MLQNIREKLSGWVAFAILGTIALSLVVTFGNIDTGFSGAGAAVTVNGEDVPLREFQTIYRNRKQQWETNYRAQLPNDLAESMADQVLQNIVSSRVIAQHVSDQGYRVSDSDLIQSIESLPAFQVGGQFSQPSYESLLRSQGQTPQRFEYDQRQNLQMAQFLESLTETAFYTPAEFRRYIELDGEGRDVEFLLLSPANRLDDAVIKDEAIAARYESNKQQYLTMESVALQYVELNYADIVADVTVSEDEARQYFEENPEEFGGPEERLARHILLPINDDEDAALASAVDIRARIDAGEAFGDLAAQYSSDTSSAGNGGELGWLGIDDSPAPEFEEALFSLEVGEVSEPVRTEFGYHLILLGNMRTSADLTFGDVKESLLERIREDAAATRFADMLDELDEQSLESLNGLQPVAEAMDLELKTVETFTRTGGEPLGFVPELIDTVFSLEVLEDGEISPVVAIEDGRAVVVHVTEHRPAVVRPLEDVREEILAELKRDDAIGLTAIAGARALEALKVNSGKLSKADMAELGLADSEIVQQKSLQRGDPSVPADLAAAIFRAPKPVTEPTEFESLLLGSGEFAVFRVMAYVPGQPESFSLQDRDARKKQLATRAGGSQAAAIVEALVQGATVNMAPNLIENELGL